MTTRPRIGFDLSPLAHPSSAGVRRATRELWRALAQRSGPFEWLPVAADTSVGSRWWRQVRVPQSARRMQLHGWHSTVSALPWFGRFERVQTVHELPWRSDAAENSGLRHRSWARSRRAAATIVPSRATLDALILERGGDADGIHLVPWGVGAPFTSELQRPRESGAKQRVVLVGGTRPKKRLDVALDVLVACHAANDCELWVTGSVAENDGDWIRFCERQADQLGARARLVLAGEIGEAALARLLRGAAAVLVVSDSEGFGLPALEAAAVGTPCVVRALGAAAEAAGPGAFPFVGGTVDAARALEAALALDEGGRAAIGRWASTRTWQQTAEQVEALWGTLLT